MQAFTVAIALLLSLFLIYSPVLFWLCIFMALLYLENNVIMVFLEFIAVALIAHES